MDDLVNVPLQRWNHLVINYSGGTLDVFLNGNLERTVSEIIPFKSNDQITIGTDDGVQGGICKVMYVQNTLDISEINDLYNQTPDGYVKKGTANEELAEVKELEDLEGLIGNFGRKYRLMNLCRLYNF